MKTTWLLDAFLLERSTPVGGPSFEQALRGIGCEVAVLSYDRNSRSVTGTLPPLDGSGPVVSYGSFAFVREARRHVGVRMPGAFCDVERLSYSAFGAHLGGLMMNDDFQLIPFGELRRRGPPDHSVFIRPNRVTKSFTGFAVKPDDFEFEVKCLAELRNVDPEELVAVARVRRIIAECRYVIASNTVVAGSTYGWEEGFLPTPETPAACDRIARLVAGGAWQADRAYTCDVALYETEDGEEAGVVELNTFSCAGLYACDPVSVARAVTKAAVEEFNGD